MDDRSFDRLARLLGEATDRRAGLKAALAAVLGGAAAVAALDAEAKRRAGNRIAAQDTRRKTDGATAQKRKKRKKCKPGCGSGFDCVKGQCACRTGITCGAACCRVGQVCRDGACVEDPEPVTCIPAGEPCKNVGRTCCDGRTCASGQGGEADVACYVPKTGRCEHTADCVYGTSCQDGRCDSPVTSGLPAGAACAIDAECISAQCGSGVCKALPGEKCGSSNNGAACKRSTDTCSGTDPNKTCLSANGAACAFDGTCLSGTCGANGKCASLAGEACGSSVDGALCADTTTPATCTAYASGSPTGDYCLKANGRACAAGSGSITADATCASGQCQNGVCVECTQSSQCPGARPVCNASGACIAETCDVCASGCTYATIQAAITQKGDGSTIAIDAGTYTENLAITDKSLTLKACNGAAVTITATSGTEVLKASITQSTTRTLSLGGLRFEGKAVSISGKDASTKMTLSMNNCTFAATGQYMSLWYIDATLDESTFLATSMFTAFPAVVAGSVHLRDCLMDGTGTSNRAMDLPGLAGTTVTLENTEVRNYHTGGTTGPIKTLGGTVLNLTGTTKIWNNSTTNTTNGGGGISLDGGALNIGADVTITGNAAPSGKGSGISNSGSANVVAATITGATTTTVFGNLIEGTTTINDPQCWANNGGSCLTA